MSLARYIRPEFGFNPNVGSASQLQLTSLPLVPTSSPLDQALVRYSNNRAILTALDGSATRKLDAENQSFLQSIFEPSVGFLGKAVKAVDKGRSLLSADISNRFSAVEDLASGKVTSDNILDVVGGLTPKILADKLTGSKVSDSTSFNPDAKFDRNTQQAIRDFWANTGAGDYLQRTINKKGLAGTPLDNRAVKAGIGFLGEVGLDPITYATLGGGAIAKTTLTKGAAAATKQFVAKRSTDFSDDVLLKAANESYRSKASSQVRSLSNNLDDKGAVKQVDEAAQLLRSDIDDATRALSDPDYLKGLESPRFASADEARVFLRDVVSDTFANEAYLGYAKGGSRGSRQALEALSGRVGLGDDFGREIFKSWHIDLRTPIRVGVPGTRGQVGLSPGGGLLFEKLGPLGRALEAGSSAKYRTLNKLGTTKPFAWLGENLSGVTGPLKTGLRKAIVNNDEFAQRGFTESLSAFEKARKEVGPLIGDLTTMTGVARAASEKLRGKYRGQKAEFGREVMRRLRKDIDQPIANEFQRDAQTAADLLLQSQDLVKNVARRNGIDINDIDDPQRRLKTKETVADEQARRPGGQFDDTNVARGRMSGVSRVGPDGKVEYFTVADINRSNPRAGFEEDAFKVHDQYVNSMVNRIANKIPISRMKEAGLFVDPKVVPFTSRNQAEAGKVSSDLLRRFGPVLDELRKARSASDDTVRRRAGRAADLDAKVQELASLIARVERGFGRTVVRDPAVLAERAALDGEASALRKIMEANAGVKTKAGRVTPGRRPRDAMQADVEAAFAVRSVERDRVFDRFRKVAKLEGSALTADELEEVFAIYETFAWSAFREGNVGLDGRVLSHPDDFFKGVEVQFSGSEVRSVPRKGNILADTADEVDRWAAMSDNEFADALLDETDNAFKNKAAVGRMTDEQFDSAFTMLPGYVVESDAAVRRMSDKQFNDAVARGPDFAIRSEVAVARMSDEQFAKAVGTAPERALTNNAAMNRIAKMAGVEDGQRTSFNEMVSRLLPSLNDLDQTIATAKVSIGLADMGVDATGPIRRGQVNLKGAKAVITMFKNGDVTTATHEMGHIFRQGLNPQQLGPLEKAYKITDGVWTRKAEELFVDDMMRFIKTSTLKTTRPGLKQAFRTMKSKLKLIWDRLKTLGKRPAPVTKFWDRVFNDTPGPGWMKRKSDYFTAKSRLDEILEQRSLLDKQSNAAASVPVEEALNESVKTFRRMFTLIDELNNEIPNAARSVFGDGDPVVVSADKIREKVQDLISEVTRQGKDFDELGKLFGGSDRFTRVGAKADKGRGQVVEELENSFGDQLLAEAVAKMFTVQDKAVQSRFIKSVFDPFNKAFKASATIGRGPAFVFRNITGGIWNAFLAGAVPQDFKAAGRYIMRLRKAHSRIVKDIDNVKAENIASYVDDILEQELSGLKVYGVNGFDLHKAMEQEGIFGTVIGSIYDDVGGEFQPGWLVGRGQQSLFNTPGSANQLSSKARQATDWVALNNPYIRFMGSMTEQSEVYLRAGSFFAGVRKYGAKEFDETTQVMAGLLVKGTQFDYSDLSPFEREIMKRIIPFYTWTRNNLPLQLRSLVNQPGRTNIAFQFNDSLKDQFGQEGERSNFLPGWIQEQDGWLSNLVVGEDPLAFGLNVPATDLNKLLPSVGAITENPTDPRVWLSSALGAVSDEGIGAVNPLVKGAVEAVSGRNTFTGADFTDQPASPIFEALSKVPLVGMPFNAYTDPDSGRTVASGFAMNQTRNFFPALSLAERTLLPLPERRATQALAIANQLGATGLPVAPLGFVTESASFGEVDRRNQVIENAIRRSVGGADIDLGEMRTAAGNNYSSEQLRTLAALGGFRKEDAKTRRTYNIRSPFAEVKLPKRRKPKRRKKKKMVLPKGPKVRKPKFSSGTSRPREIRYS